MNHPKLHITPWGDDHRVGHSLLDKQHRQLHELCQEALKYIDDDSSIGSDMFHRLLNDLACFASEHFSTEEFVLSSLNYPLFDEHKRQHDEYQERLTELLFAATTGDARKSDLILLLKDWWEQHMMNDDKKYQAFIASFAR